MPARTVLFVAMSGNVSGAEKSLYSLLSHLNTRQYHPLVVCPSEGLLTRKLSEAGIEVSIQDVRGVVSPDPVQVGNALPFVRALARLARDRDVALIHANSYRIGLPCSLAARHIGIPVIWHARDIPLSRVKRPMVAWLATQWADHVIAVSEAVADAVFSLRGRRIPRVSVIYNGVDLTQFADWGVPDPAIRREFGCGSDDLLVGNVGSLIPWKGQDRFLLAAARVAKVIPKARYLVVGSQLSTAIRRRIPRSSKQYEAHLHELTEQPYLRGRVFLTGYRTDVLCILRSLDLYVHSAIRPDPLPRILLETMASGTCIVAPAQGGALEIVEDKATGMLYPAGDVEAMAQAMLNLLQDAETRRRVAVSGRHRAEHLFTIQQHVRQVEATYKQVLQKSRE